jgi:hypothetical protein
VTADTGSCLKTTAKEMPMSRLQNEPLLQRAVTSDDLPKNDKPQSVDEVPRPDDQGNSLPQTPRESFLIVLLRALSAWSV